MEWLGRGTYPSRGIKNNDFQSPRLRNYEILSYFWWPLRSPGSPDELPSSADSVILPVCSFKWGLRGWKQGHQFFSIDRMSMNIVYVHHYTGIYVSLHKDFHVHVYFKHLTDLRPGHLDSRAIGTVVGVLSGDMWGLGHPGHLCHNGGVLWMVFSPSSTWRIINWIFIGFFNRYSPA